MNLDVHPMNLDGANSYYKALNARQESIDGGQLVLTNEPGNELCLSFKEGYSVVGRRVIPELDQTCYLLVNEELGLGEIGMATGDLYNSCKYIPLVRATAKCLGFDMDAPIHKIAYKLTNKTIEIYWTDGASPMKWVDLMAIPYDGDGMLNCNHIKIFPDFQVPTVEITEVGDAGSLKTGSYQFFIAYANSKGEEISQYYSATNPAAIWQNETTNRLDFETNKSIQINIDHLDSSYKFFNLAVARNVNLTETFELVGTFPIAGGHYEYLYTGNDKSPRPLTTSDIFFRYPFYSKAETLVAQNNMLMLGGLREEEVINYQPIVNKFKFQWETWRVPYNEFEGYQNGANTANLRGHMRDEVYPYEVAFIHRSGRISYSFHVPGPGVRPEDRVPVTNEDANNVVEDPCDAPQQIQKWQVYNTAYIVGDHPAYEAAADKSCYKGPYQFGEFASWESTERYPDNAEIWGNLAGRPIRHHKFPDSLVTHIHDGGADAGGVEYSICPIGIKINLENIQQAIRDSHLTEEQKHNIVGIKILRGNRASHKSVIGKGLLFNVGKYTRDDTIYLYPNYPYNDLRPDPFIAVKQVDQKSGANEQLRLDGFGDPDVSKKRFTFHSPDTSFVRPALGGYLKLETAAYGKAKAHIVEVQDNAKYAMGTRQGLQTALAIGLVSILGYEAGFPQATVSLNLGNFLPTYNAMVDLLKKLIPYRQYGYQYTSVGIYSKFEPVKNDGNKIRRILGASYLEPGLIALENDIGPINNYQRESSVYIRVNENLPFPHEIENVPADESRFTRSSVGGGPSVDDLREYWNGFTRQERIEKFGKGLNTSIILAQIFGRSYDAMIAMGGAYSAAINENVRQHYIDFVLNGGITGFTTPSRQVNISSLYASIKRNRPDQYGQIYSYQTIDTGYTYFFDLENLSQSEPPETVFGGDTFINRYGIKRKLPFFLANTVGSLDDTDVFYDQLGNIGYPIYYLSTGPKEYTPSERLMDKLQRAYNAVSDTSFGTGLGAALSAGLSRFIPGMTAMLALVEEIINRIGVKNNNLDRYSNKGFWEEGMMYLFAYGIPYFFVESDINLDYRQAENPKEMNFFPNVGTDIPDPWLQEKNVSIAHDNYYLYNRSLSKQNMENAFSHLPIDFKQVRDAIVERSTRVIYSQPSNFEEKQNNWLIFKANSYYDFPLTYGKLIDLNAIEKEQVLVRFENNSALYNAYITLDTSNKTAITGTGNMFANPPVEFSRADIGYTGSQHKAFNSTKYGHFWVDAKRGNIFLLQANGAIRDISRQGMKNWFKENLPFNILRYFDEIPVDNSFKNIGIAAVWDDRYDRYFLTKKDYVPLNNRIIYDSSKKAFILDGKVISINDKEYFCDASWTVAYSPPTESWVSFYSFTPNFYVEQNDYFQTGVDSGIWNHHLRDDRQYQHFYGSIAPFEIYTLTSTDIHSKILQSISFRNEVYQYITNYERILKRRISFDKALLYSADQCSGDLNLEIQPKSDMRSKLLSVTEENLITISLSEADGIYKFNQFYNLVNGKEDSPIILFSCANTTEEVNVAAMNYTLNNYVIKSRLKNDWLKVKLSNTRYSQYKYIFKWLVNKSIKSVR